jgi:hypothetical protein
MINSHIASVDPHAMPIIEAFECARKVDMKVIVGRITLLRDSCQISQKIFVNVGSEWFWRLKLVVYRCVES